MGGLRKRLRAAAACLAISCAASPAFSQSQLKILHTFGPTEGGVSGPLVEFQPGKFVGLNAGIYDSVNDLVVSPSLLYAVTSAGGYTVLHTFNPSAEGQTAYGSLMAANDGGFYGAAMGAGHAPATVFRSDRQGHFVTIWSGAAIPSPVTEAGDGNLYGVSSSGDGSSTLFRVDTSGDYSEVATVAADGQFPANEPPVCLGNYLYAALSSGANGTVYRLATDGTSSALATIPALSGVLSPTPNGQLYGAAQNPDGTSYIFHLNLDGTYTPIYSFSSFATLSPLLLASDGRLYGIAVQAAAQAFVYSINPDGTDYQVVTTFVETLLTGVPVPPLVQGSDGKLYGVANTVNNSEVFVLDLSLPKPSPGIIGFHPPMGFPGTRVLIQGTNLLNPQSITFNGVPATAIRSVSPSYLYAVVPRGASTGPITVTTANGSIVSVQELYIPSQRIRFLEQ